MLTHGPGDLGGRLIFHFIFEWLDGLVVADSWWHNERWALSVPCRGRMLSRACTMIHASSRTPTHLSRAAPTAQQGRSCPSSFVVGNPMAAHGSLWFSASQHRRGSPSLQGFEASESKRNLEIRSFVYFSWRVQKADYHFPVLK